MLAKALVDTAIKVEAEGLRGKVYLDSRGIAKLEDTNHQPGSYGDYDRALLITAKGIEEQTELEVASIRRRNCSKREHARTRHSTAAGIAWRNTSMPSIGNRVPWRITWPAAKRTRSATRAVTPGARNCSRTACARRSAPFMSRTLARFRGPTNSSPCCCGAISPLSNATHARLPYNSWMMTLIGDPLYRPFKYRVGMKVPTVPPQESSEQVPAAAATPDK